MELAYLFIFNFSRSSFELKACAIIFLSIEIILHLKHSFILRYPSLENRLLKLYVSETSLLVCILFVFSFLQSFNSNLRIETGYNSIQYLKLRNSSLLNLGSKVLRYYKASVLYLVTSDSSIILVLEFSVSCILFVHLSTFNRMH